MTKLNVDGFGVYVGKVGEVQFVFIKDSGTKQEVAIPLETFNKITHSIPVLVD